VKRVKYRDSRMSSSAGGHVSSCVGDGERAGEDVEHEYTEISAPLQPCDTEEIT